jgi:hypothetical protein
MGTSPGSSNGPEPGRRPCPGTPQRSRPPRPRPPGRRRTRLPGASILYLGITLSGERGEGERAHCRRSARQSPSGGMPRMPRRAGKSVRPFARLTRLPAHDMHARAFRLDLSRPATSTSDRLLRTSRLRRSAAAAYRHLHASPANIVAEHRLTSSGLTAASYRATGKLLLCCQFRGRLAHLAESATPDVRVAASQQSIRQGRGRRRFRSWNPRGSSQDLDE